MTDKIDELFENTEMDRKLLELDDEFHEYLSLNYYDLLVYESQKNKYMLFRYCIKLLEHERNFFRLAAAQFMYQKESGK